MTHAFFKALLFLAAGSVIMALHHEQDMRKMGGLWRAMPWTCATAWIGTLALIGFPGTAGFFSKDALIEAVHAAQIPGANVAYFCILVGVAVTAFYSLRLMFLVFHGSSRVDEHTKAHVHESPRVVVIPLVLLAIPSALIAWPSIEPILFGGYFGDAIFVLEQHDTVGQLGENFHGPQAFLIHGFQTLPLYMMLLGAVAAWLLYWYRPAVAAIFAQKFGLIRKILEQKYGFDMLYQQVIANNGRRLGKLLWQVGDVNLIDGKLVNGTAALVSGIAARLRQMQTGFLYHYAFVMILGVVAMLSWLLLRI